METDKGFCNCILCGKKGYNILVIEDTTEKLIFDGQDCFVLYKRFASIYGAEFPKFIGSSQS
ncbi:MAG: hypothetical protein P0116_10355 [Candidatus Nitrosocosmicus sp.]|nr:hypothetical protein [Candidatus Nitrosocosmicus sp.]